MPDNRREHLKREGRGLTMGTQGSPGHLGQLLAGIDVPQNCFFEAGEVS
jgi:hypothetical protein